MPPRPSRPARGNELRPSGIRRIEASRPSSEAEGFRHADPRPPAIGRPAHPHGPAGGRPCLHAQQIRFPRRQARCRGLPGEARKGSSPRNARQADGQDARQAHGKPRPGPCPGGRARDVGGSGPAIRAHPTAEEAPDLSGLTLFMRAITPPGRTRRYDSRFFVADAEQLANIDQPHHDGGGELLTLSWLSTGRDRLPRPAAHHHRRPETRLKPFLDRGQLPAQDCPASFQYYRGRNWIEDEIRL
jgi:hypothetical protein